MHTLSALLLGLAASASTANAAAAAPAASNSNLWNITNLSIVGSGPVGSAGSVKFSFNVASTSWGNTACTGTATSDQTNYKCPGAQDITGFTNEGTCKAPGVSFVFDAGTSASGVSGYYMDVAYKKNGDYTTGCVFLNGKYFTCGKDAKGKVFESYTGPKSVQINLNAPGAGCPAPPSIPTK